MMSCFGCISQAEMSQYQKQIAIDEAQKFANDNKTTVAIYHEMGTWKYIQAEIAQKEGIPATIFISHNAT